MLFTIFIIPLFSICYLVYRNVKDRVYRIFLFLMILGFTIYSGLGIFTENENIQQNDLTYIIQFLLFICMFLLGYKIVMKYRIHSYMKELDRIFANRLFIIMGYMYIAVYIYKCIYSGVVLSDILNIQKLFVNYSATTFATRVTRNSDSIYSIITNQVTNICAPFFYIMLYNVRKNHKKFLTLYCLPIVLALLSDGYLSRNKIAVYVVFIFIYLVDEKIISKGIAKMIVIGAVPLLLLIFATLESIRSGTVSGEGMLESIKHMVVSEISYPQYYDNCVAQSKDVSALNFLIYIIVVCIPSQFYSLFGYQTPNLAYSFTKAIIGLSYGQTNNYYILLPSVLGEALMLFGKHFAFVYGFIYGIISTWFLKVLKEHECTKYLMIYFLLDFFRQFRGGSQFVISVWETQIIPMIIIVAIVSTISKGKRGKNEKCINNYTDI